MFSVASKYSWKCRTTSKSRHDGVGMKLQHTPHPRLPATYCIGGWSNLKSAENGQGACGPFEPQLRGAFAPPPPPMNASSTFQRHGAPKHGRFTTCIHLHSLMTAVQGVVFDGILRQWQVKELAKKKQESFKYQIHAMTSMQILHHRLHIHVPLQLLNCVSQCCVWQGVRW